jgi:integrase
MASIQKKGDAWYCQFLYRRQRHTFAVGEVDEAEARAVAAKVGYLLMRLKQNLLDIPAGCDIVTFVRFDGNPPTDKPHLIAKEHTFEEVSDQFLQTFSNGAIEANTLCTARIHLNHATETLGKTFPLNALTHADLQRHITRRTSGETAVAPVTVKKEIDTFRAAWNWASRTGMVTVDFPGSGLVYPKADERLPFMTWKEIDRRLAAGGDPDTLWECLYLTAAEIAELLQFVRTLRAPPWVFPALLFVAHTGCRRSEMIRARTEDVNDGVVTIREKKRVKGRRSSRRVPLSTELAATLRKWLKTRKGQPYLFGIDGMLSVQTTQKAFVRVLKGSKWTVLKGWHVLRHSFISALASRNIDQRMIDEFVGHQSDAMRVRYRHLYPSSQADAIRTVFG